MVIILFCSPQAIFDCVPLTFIGIVQYDLFCMIYQNVVEEVHLVVSKRC